MAEVVERRLGGIVTQVSVDKLVFKDGSVIFLVSDGVREVSYRNPALTAASAAAKFAGSTVTLVSGSAMDGGTFRPDR